MADYSAETNSMKDIALLFRTHARTLDGVVSQIQSTSRAIARNRSLGDLGYSGMADEVAGVLAGQSHEVGNLADKLSSVADTYESYEKRVLGTMGSNENFLKDFLVGDLKVSGAVASGKIAADGTLLGLPISGALSGSLLGGSASLKAGGAFDVGKGNLYAEAKAKAEGYLAEGKMEGDFGFAHGEASAKLFTGAVEGSLTGSLFKNGMFNPDLAIKGSAKASAASGSVEVRSGSEDFNQHVSASGDLMTAYAGASAHVGTSGVGAKVEAGAYMAKGELSGGFTFMGIKVDVGVEGKAGGAGVEAGFGVDAEEKTVSGSIGAGLGIGAGINFKVDFSGFGKAVNNTINWWNGLWH